MAFRIRDLSVLAYAHGFTLWHYKAEDRLGTVAGRGFFDAAADMLAGGDMVLLSAPDGGRISVVVPIDGGIALTPLA